MVAIAMVAMAMAMAMAHRPAFYNQSCLAARWPVSPTAHWPAAAHRSVYGCRRLRPAAGTAMDDEAGLARDSLVEFSSRRKGKRLADTSVGCGVTDMFTNQSLVQLAGEKEVKRKSMVVSLQLMNFFVQVLEFVSVMFQFLPQLPLPRQSGLDQD